MTMPAQSAVAVINTITRKIVGTVPTGEKSKPARVAIQTDGRYVWVGLDDSPMVAVIDTATNKLVATAQAGAGLHNIALTSGNSAGPLLSIHSSTCKTSRPESWAGDVWA